ncbi:hypothetical protein ACWEO2_41995 [Nocardia sp. NPDC004278]
MDEKSSATSPRRPVDKGSGPASLSSTPWSSWSKVSAPQSTPPQPASEQPRRPTPARPQKAEKKQTKKQAKPGPSSDLLRLGRELADRHGLTVTGFDTPDLDPASVKEFVAAIDAVLPHYPEIDLRSVRIEPTATHLVEFAEPDDISGRVLTLNSMLVMAAAPPRTGATFDATVRALGRALIAAGGGRAAASTHRVLIGLYLDSLNIRQRYDTIARVGWRYRAWLTDEGIPTSEGRLDAMAALEEAFLAVVRDGGSAGNTAKALHQAVVSAARVVG